MSEQSNQIRDAIAQAIGENPVILFMKGTPDAAGVRLLRPHRRRAAGARRAVRRRRHPARPAHPPGALGALAVADDPAALRQRRARRRLRHRHRDVRERRAGRDARRRAARGGRARRSSPPWARGRWASRTACRRRRGGALARVRCRHARRDAAPPGPALGRAAPGRSSTRRACPAPRCGSTLEGAADTAQAIRRLAVRGAPLIGVAAAYGLAMEVAPPARPRHAGARLGAAALGAPDRGQPRLCRRPRARRRAGGGAGRRWRRAARDEAERIHAEEDAASAAIAAHGADLLAGARRIATHCNTGALAAGGQGHGAGGDPRAARSAARCTCSPARRGRCCRARG